MERMVDKRAIAAMLLLFACAGVSVAQTAREVLDLMREKYETVRDAQISFTQRITFAMTKVDQSSAGTLLLKKENMYRVEMDRQTFVTDGKTVWSFSSSTNQVLIDRFKAESRGITPERILLGAPDEFTATILGKETLGGREVIALKLTPRAESSPGSTTRLWVDTRTWLVRKASLDDGSGKETVYIVSDMRINTDIADAEFTYRIPEGAEVVDLR